MQPRKFHGKSELIRRKEYSEEGTSVLQMFHIYPKDFFSFEECRFHMPTIRKDIICR